VWFNARSLIGDYKTMVFHDVHLTNDSFNDIQGDAQLQDWIGNNIVRLFKTQEIKIATG